MSDTFAGDMCARSLLMCVGYVGPSSPSHNGTWVIHLSLTLCNLVLRAALGDHHFKWNKDYTTVCKVAVDVPAHLTTFTRLAEVATSSAVFHNIRDPVRYVETLQTTGGGDKKPLVFYW